MESYYEPSISAYILLQDVMNEMKIHTSLDECRKSGIDKKIIQRCNRLIDKTFKNEKKREILKHFIASSFSNNMNTYMEDDIYDDDDDLFN